MVSISKFGDSAIKFTFDDSDHYLMGDGEITVPVNGLILVLDESDMATFKKIDGDPFISFNIADSNFSSKSDLETFYKENMVGSTGGGGVTSGEVQTMIDESISGLAESSAVTEEISEAVSGKADSSAVTEEISAAVSGKADTSAVTASINAVSGAIPTQYVKEARFDMDEGKQRWYVFQKEGQNPFNIYNFSINGRMPLSKQNGTYSGVDNFSLVETSSITSAITSSSTNSQVAGAKAVYDAIGDKADTTAVTASINSAVSGKMDTSVFNTYSASTNARISEDEEVTSAALNELNDALDDKADTSAVTASIAAAVSGKQDTLIAGTNITISGNVISAQGGGSITIDPTLDSNSNNAVANSAITNGINSRVLNVKHGDAAYAGQGVKILQKTFNGSTNTGWGFLSSINNKPIIDGDYLNVNKFSLVETSAITSSVTSASTDSQVPSAKAVYDALQEGGGGGGLPESAFTAYTAATDARLAEDEEVTAAALNTLNTATAANTTALGGLKLVSLTQAQYEALTTKDASTLYIITSSN